MDFLSSLFGTKPTSISSASAGNANSTTPMLLQPAPKVGKMTPTTFSPMTISGPASTPALPQTGGTPNYASFADQQWLAYQANKPKVATPAPAPVATAPTLASYPVGNYTPKNFTPTPVGNTVDSSYLSPGSLQDLLDTRKAKEAAMMGGTDTNLLPSDTLQGKIANQLYQSKLFTPDEQSLIQNGQDLVAQINAKKLAARRKATQLVENGTITKEQAQSFVAEEERRANNELADLSVQQDSNTAKLSALGLIRQNQVGALESIATMLKGSEVAPGSSVYNPITGVQYQGQGASPSTILSAAQSLKQNDQMTGNLKLTADGNVDDSYYYSQAQGMFSGGMGGGMSGGTPGGTPSGTPGQIPAQVQTYLNASGGQYINEDRVPAGQRDIVRQLAAQNGVPFLSAGDVSSVQSIDYTQANLAKMSAVVDQVLFDGPVGKVGNIATATLNQFFPTSEVRTAFNANRETAIKAIQSLVAGSGSGFRLTQPEIDTTVSQMPTERDSLSVAKAKLAWVNSFLDTKRNLALTGTIGPQTSAPGLKPQATSQNVINTKIGPVDNSWFQ